MATTPATEKQLKFLGQLTGKDYSGSELTASEASEKIEKALANKGKEVAELPPQPSDKLLPEHQEVIDEVVKPKPDSKNRAFALSYSKDITVARIAQGKDETYAQTIIRAEAFCSYLDSGITTEKKKPPEDI